MFVCNAFRKHLVICYLLGEGVMHGLFKSDNFQDSRVRTMNDVGINPNGKFILYWMTSTRRFHYNASLEHAHSLSKALGKPILVVEAISISHKFANDRFLSFMVQGMMNNARDYQENNVSYIPWVEIKEKPGNKMLASLSEHSSCVILDDYPTYTPVSYTHLTLPTIYSV